MVLCFDLRISEFVLRRLSPCCTCLAKSSEKERQPLMGWSDDTILRVHSRSRTDSGIFQDESSFSHLSLSLHGLNEIPEGRKGTSVAPLFSLSEQLFIYGRSRVVSRAEKRVCGAGERPETDPLGFVSAHHHSALSDHPRLQEKLLEELVHGNLLHVGRVDLGIHVHTRVDGHGCR